MDITKTELITKVKDITDLTIKALDQVKDLTKINHNLIKLLNKQSNLQNEKINLLSTRIDIITGKDK